MFIAGQFHVRRRRTIQVKNHNHLYKWVQWVCEELTKSRWPDDQRWPSIDIKVLVVWPQLTVLATSLWKTIVIYTLFTST